MKRSALMLLSLLWAVSAAAAPLVTDQPVPWNGGVVKLGDSESQVRAVTGKYPDRAVPLNPSDSLPIGEQWTFIGHGPPAQALWVELMGGRVTRVWTEPFDSSGAAKLK